MPKPHPTNLASLARAFVDWAESRGLDRRSLLLKASLDERTLEDPNGRVRCEAHLSLWQEAERALSDPEFSLRAADALHPSSFGVVGLLAMTSDTVEESVFRAVQYGRLLQEDAVSRAYVTDELFVIEFHLTEPAPPAVAACALAAYRVFMARWTGEPITPKNAFLTAAPPAGADVLERLFDCPIHFRHSVNALVFDRAVTKLPLTSSSRDVATYLDQMARSLLGSLETEGKRERRLQDAVGEAVRASITEGDLSIERVARRLGVSSRTLQRSLRAEGLEYRKLLDDTRFSMAAPLVTTSSLSIDEVAERLGYAESKAFRRAFRRWTGGVSPARLRGSAPRRP